MFFLVWRLMGAGKAELRKAYLFPNLRTHTHPPPQTPQMLISLGDVGCQSRELAAWILPWLSLQPYILSQAEPDWSSCEYHSAHRPKKGIFTSMLNTRTRVWSCQVCFVLMLWELFVSLVNSFRMEPTVFGALAPAKRFLMEIHVLGETSNNLRLSRGQS